MTIKKFRLFLASDVGKEEQWLTAMSKQGLHFYKYKFGFYYFKEDANTTYIYQIDFLQDADETYYQLYKDAGWEHVTLYWNAFQYFRIDANQEGIKKIYSDEESVADSYKRMLRTYLMLFFCLVAMQAILISMWKSTIVDFITNGIVFAVIILYIFLLLSLRRRVNAYRKYN